MSSLQIGRLLIGPPLQWYEQLGDPVATQGGGVVPGQRTAPQFSVSVATWAADGQTDTVTARLSLRRRLRGLLNNSDLKFGGFLYLIYSDDPENSGWYAPDQAMLEDWTSPVGLATGLWQLASQNWYVAGKMRTHREARQIAMKDLRTGLYPRDTLEWLYSTDFSALSALALTRLPNGASQAALTVSGQVCPLTSLPTGRDGGIAELATGLTDLEAVSYERPESALNLSDVIVYDRRGQITAPSTGPDTSWEEAYGSDHAWNWLTAGQPNDAPVLDNGLVRVRYDGTHLTGFRIDVWNGSAYVEQGKVLVLRNGDAFGYCSTWISAGLVEYTPDRAVVSLVLANPADAHSRERVFITMRRGELGVTFEAYPALKAAGTQADATIVYSVEPGDANDSFIKDDTQASLGIPASPQNSGPSPCVIDATAGTGSALLAGANLGITNFTGSENFVAGLRCQSAIATVGPYQINIVTQQAANSYCSVDNETFAFGSAANCAHINGQNGAGYISARVSFAATTADQVNEAESIMFLTGTTSTVTDSTASGGSAVKDIQTAPTNPTIGKSSLSSTLAQGTYRAFARVKVGSGTASYQWQIGSATGVMVTTTSTSWIWVDLGELTATGAGASFDVIAWSTSGTAEIDRLELFLMQDRTRAAAIYSGARDAGQAALYDSRTIGALVAR